MKVARSDQHEVAGAAVGRELLDVIAMTAQDLFDHRGRAVSSAYPDNFRRRAGDDAALVKICILRDDDEPMCFRVVPHRFVQGTTQVDRLDVRRSLIQVRKEINEPRGEILVEKQPHAFDISWRCSRSAA